MRNWMAAGLVLAITALSGCIAELLVIRTVDEIQRSGYRAEYVLAKAPDIVTHCMMQTLYSYTNATGTRPYAAVATQAFGTTQAITLRTPHNLATRMYGGGDELLFLIENSAHANGGTKSTVWVNQRLLSPQPYLDTLVDVMKVCLLATPSASQSPSSASTTQKLRDLEIKEEVMERKITLEGKRWDTDGGL